MKKYFVHINYEYSIVITDTGKDFYISVFMEVGSWHKVARVKTQEEVFEMFELMNELAKIHCQGLEDAYQNSFEVQIYKRGFELC